MMWLFCNRVSFNKKELLDVKGPLLITANHPDSFFDALVLVVQFKQQVHFLARGDVFIKKRVAAVLRWLGLIPIYRITEGAQNLHLNEETFETCRQLFREGGIVLIFIEGLCENNWVLRPFKKGAARLATSSWAGDGMENELQVMPLGISYNHYRGFGKNIIVEMTDPVRKEQLQLEGEGATAVNMFNIHMRNMISQLMVRLDTAVKQKKINAAFAQATSTVAVKEALYADRPRKVKAGSLLWFIPAALGAFVHAPLYIPLSQLVKKKTKGTVFYDSVLFASLLVCYPLYLLLLFLLLWHYAGGLVALLATLAAPLLARAAVVYRAQHTTSL
ncbi:1-acyl-sn-glycerol-3-phosphate acyltransferase [Aridibaculum aurantiacum]|uniref:1-acyl-sn-glycerol-3-phosphate acyltransferase n=1 Tax=Aridibaculum aurantiacum TaxID=2810307 RepID=UPI001A97C1CC|nr:1-acyl-sn-glycerol-3-phosphate acyltransferase [Aridibaculum aurantiacum]